eukprot:TRINITY_DN6242_c0_g1_i1.p1 TRINITY_DN6242_c0_g1~~TRINITY_DN6242_c0_g1_i1.p1  ORF type:complete len:576 (+),score=99.40 TRINITY_DN6242_c0_g1_i1:133-1860(+)
MATPGFAIPCTPIQVDLWSHRPTSRLFFLTHAHTDHTQGLTATFTLGPIYCTAITKKIIVHRLGLEPSRIRTLELNEPTSIALDEDGLEYMTVTAVDANHCLGACMLVFQGYFGTILATGDFRYTPSMLKQLPSHVDHLYLDNTYCHPKHNHPPRDAVTTVLLDNIRALPPCHVFFAVDNLGKEELLLALAKQEDAALHVSAPRMALYKKLGLGAYFTTEGSETYYHVIDRHSLTAGILEQCKRKYGQVLIILVSGHGMRSRDNEWTQLSEWIGAINKRILQIPYSNHSSFKELDTFVNAVKPSGLTNMLTNRSDRLYQAHGSHRVAQVRPKITIPPSVDRFMFRKGHALARHASETRFNRQSPGLKRSASYRSKRSEALLFSTPSSDEEDIFDKHDKRVNRKPDHAGQHNQTPALCSRNPGQNDLTLQKTTATTALATVVAESRSPLRNKQPKVTPSQPGTTKDDVSSRPSQLAAPPVSCNPTLVPQSARQLYQRFSDDYQLHSSVTAAQQTDLAHVTADRWRGWTDFEGIFSSPSPGKVANGRMLPTVVMEACANLELKGETAIPVKASKRPF